MNSNEEENIEYDDAEIEIDADEAVIAILEERDESNFYEYKSRDLSAYDRRRSDSSSDEDNMNNNEELCEEKKNENIDSDVDILDYDNQYQSLADVPDEYGEYVGFEESNNESSGIFNFSGMESSDMSNLENFNEKNEIDSNNDLPSEKVNSNNIPPLTKGINLSKKLIIISNKSNRKNTANQRSDEKC